MVDDAGWVPEMEVVGWNPSSLGMSSNGSELGLWIVVAWLSTVISCPLEAEFKLDSERIFILFASEWGNTLNGVERNLLSPISGFLRSLLWGSCPH